VCQTDSGDTLLSRHDTNRAHVRGFLIGGAAVRGGRFRCVAVISGPWRSLPARGKSGALRAAARLERWHGRQNPGVGSPQTLSEQERRTVAGWAADCAERVVGLFESSVPGDPRPRDAIARTRAFANGELEVSDEIRRRFAGAGAASGVSPAAAAAARAAGQASAVAHMGAHALGAAAYAAKAVGLAEPAKPDALANEVEWQLSVMSADVRAALRKLPPVGHDRSGPLGPGLLASGMLGAVIHELQDSLTEPEH